LAAPTGGFGRYHAEGGNVIGIIWDLYQSHRIGQLDDRISDVQAARTHDQVARDAAYGLEEKVDRLALICCALFELLQESSGVSDEQLRKKIAEIDRRDGEQDGRITPRAKQCPKCSAMMSPKFGRCLFCGHEDETSEIVPGA
jgi:hypothetical protein